MPGIPSNEEAKQLVATALDARHAAAADAERVVLARTTVGLMRMMVDPTGGALAMIVIKVFGAPSVGDQVAQRVVDYWLSGVRDSPPFAQRPLMWPLVLKAFHTILEPTPGAVEVATLINIAIGLLNEQYPTHHEGVAGGASQVVVHAYAMGM